MEAFGLDGVAHCIWMHAEFTGNSANFPMFGIKVAANLHMGLWAAVFWIFARNAPVAVRPRSLGDMLKVLAHGKLSWALSAFYFLTFGGFVASTCRAC
jgi:nitrate/nitrite transporter NarK